MGGSVAQTVFIGDTDMESTDEEEEMEEEEGEEEQYELPPLARLVERNDGDVVRESPILAPEQEERRLWMGLEECLTN